MIENILCGSNYDGYLWNKIFQKRIIENNNLKFLKKCVDTEGLFSYNNFCTAEEHKLLNKRKVP